MSLPTKANVARPEAWGYDALIEYGPTDPESLYLRLAVGPGREMNLQTAVTPDERIPNLAVNPEELRAESGRSHGRDDFTGGEGLDFDHRPDPDPIDPARYWASAGIDVDNSKRGESREIELLKGTASIRTEDVGGIPFAAMERIGTVVYAVSSDSTLVDRTTNPTAGTPTWSTENPGGTGDITDLAVLGGELYAAQPNDVRKRSTGGAWSSFWADTFTRIWGVKGRLLAADNVASGGVLWTSDGGGTLLYTLAPGETWNDVTDAGAAILAAASDGYIYAFAEEDGSLVLRGQTLIPGEKPTAITSAQGLVFVGTSEATTAGGAIGRLWVSLLIGLRLRENQILREWGEPTTAVDHSPKKILSSREAVWTAIEVTAGETQVWKYNLGTTAVSRDLTIADPGQGEGMVSIDDRLFVNVDGQGVYREATTYVSTGYLIGPAADFFTAGQKTWVGARLQTGSLPAGTQVDLYYSTDPAALEDDGHASWTLAMSATPASPGDGSEVALTGVAGRYIIGKLVLTPNGTNTATPTVLAYSFRGLPSSTEEDIPLPVNISDRLELPHRKPLRVSGVGDAVYEKLLDLKGSAVTLTLLRPDKVYKGQILSVSAPIPELPERGSPTVYAQVLVRGQLQ